MSDRELLPAVTTTILCFCELPCQPRDCNPTVWWREVTKLCEPAISRGADPDHLFQHKVNDQGTRPQTKQDIVNTINQAFFAPIAMSGFSLPLGIRKTFSPTSLSFPYSRSRLLWIRPKRPDEMRFRAGSSRKLQIFWLFLSPRYFAVLSTRLGPPTGVEGCWYCSCSVEKANLRCQQRPLSNISYVHPVENHRGFRGRRFC